MTYQEGYVYHIKNEYFEKVHDDYLDHIHTRNNNPVPIKHSLHKEIKTNMKRLRQLHSRGKKVIFPDINRLEQIMLSE
jgi:hypothetical protein